MKIFIILMMLMMNGAYASACSNEVYNIIEHKERYAKKCYNYIIHNGTQYLSKENSGCNKWSATSRSLYVIGEECDIPLSAEFNTKKLVDLFYKLKTNR